MLPCVEAWEKLRCTASATKAILAHVVQRSCSMPWLDADTCWGLGQAEVQALHQDGSVSLHTRSLKYGKVWACWACSALAAARCLVFHLKL